MRQSLTLAPRPPQNVTATAWRESLCSRAEFPASPSSADLIRGRESASDAPAHGISASVASGDRAVQSGSRFSADFLEGADCTARIPCYTAVSRLPALVRRSEPQERPMPDKHESASGFQYSITNLKPAEPTQKIAVTFPDGARREFPKGITGLDIAKGISPSLAKRTLAMGLDGELTDLADHIEHDVKIEFVARDDPRALEMIRHDAAHVLAEAVQSLWPGTQVTIGPVIENGFYYDFFRNEPFTLDDLPAIEKKMREIIARDKPFTREVWSRDEAKRVFRDKGEL